MTDQEFKVFDRHKAENAIAQRDDALKRIEASDSERVKLADIHAKAIADLKSAHEADIAKAKETHTVELATKDAEIAKLNADFKMVNEQMATVTKDLADAKAKCENMEGHPDVITTRKEAAAKAREAAKTKAKADIEAAEKILAETE